MAWSLHVCVTHCVSLSCSCHCLVTTRLGETFDIEGSRSATAKAGNETVLLLRALQRTRQIRQGHMGGVWVAQ
jgi:hypothetical protein